MRAMDLLQQLKKETVQMQQSLCELKSEISEQIALINTDKALEKERENAKRYKQAWHQRTSS